MEQVEGGEAGTVDEVSWVGKLGGVGKAGTNRGIGNKLDGGL